MALANAPPTAHAGGFFMPEKPTPKFRGGDRVNWRGTSATVHSVACETCGDGTVTLELDMYGVPVPVFGVHADELTHAR